MSRSGRKLPFPARPSDDGSTADGSTRSRAQERMDELLRRAELDASERAAQPPIPAPPATVAVDAAAVDAAAVDVVAVDVVAVDAANPEAFEPPDVSPWSSAEGHVDLNRNWYSDEFPPPDGEAWGHDIQASTSEDSPLDGELEPAAADGPTMIDPVLHSPEPTLDAPTLLRGKKSRPSLDSERNVLPFRRRSQQRRIRRLRRHPLVRWMAPLATALVILAVPLGIAAWFLGSPSFELNNVVVLDGDFKRVDRTWVQGTLRGFEGSNIWLLPLERAESVLATHPWIADVALRKQPPHGLLARVVERTEAALYRDPEEGLVFVDAEGRRIAPWSMSKDSEDLLILSGLGQPNHLAAAVELIHEIEQAAPPWARGLSEVEILSELDYRLYTRDLPFPLLVRSGTIHQKARHLQALLPRILDRFGSVGAVDLRFARRIIIEPVDSASRAT